jgi:hypothetical protein
MLNIEPTRDHPFPYVLSDDEPKTQADSIAVAVNTIDLLEQLGAGIEFSADDSKEAVKLITQATNTPKHFNDAGHAKAAHAILRRHDYQSFDDVQQARNFVTNRLIELADCGDPKLELKALELLGKHSDVGLFTNRSEITVNHRSSESLENSIKERIKRLLNSPDEVVDVTPLDDLDTHLGAFEPAGSTEEIEGASSAMRIPRIPMTTINSSRVNPLHEDFTFNATGGFMSNTH